MEVDIDDKEQYRIVKNTAIKILSIRDHSTLELERKLKSRRFDIEVIKSVLVDLKKLELLNEDRFVQSYIRSKKAKGYGYYAIKMELKERGICIDLIDKYLDSSDSEWDLIAKSLFLKHIGSQGFSNIKERERFIRFLKSHGFSFDQIKSVFKDANDL